MAFRPIPRPLIVVAAFLSTAGATQEAPSPVPTVTPTPVPSAVPVPLATPSLTPRPGIDDVPTPVFVPNPRPTPTASPASARPTPVATPDAAPTATPIPIASPVSTPTPPATGVARAPIETVILPQAAPAPVWPWVLGGAALLLVLIGLVGLRRRREQWDEEVFADEALPDPSVAPLPAHAAKRARLTVALRPMRAGLNLISATAESEVTIANIGDAPAREIHATLRLTSAGEGQDAELAAFYADASGRSATPMFALAPGEERRFRAVTALPHDAIQAIDAGGRPMFVPLLALSVRYRDGEGERRIGQAFAVGVTQGDGAKLAPLWLDGPSRSYDNVAARPTGEPVER